MSRFENIIDFEDETFEDLKEEDDTNDWDWWFYYFGDDCDSCTGD